MNTQSPQKTPSPKSLPKGFLLRLAASELMNQKQLTVFFILNLTIGLLSFVLLDSFKQSLDEYLSANSQAMMTGDLRISARRAFTQAEEELIRAKFGEENIAQRTSFFSMSSHEGSSKLVNVDVINDQYPLYGQVLLRDFDGNIFPMSEVRDELDEGQVAVVYSELAYFYEIEAGDSIVLNSIPYEVKYIVEQDAGASFNFSAIAPKVYLSEKVLPEGFFEQFGITLRSRLYARTDADANLTALVEDLRSTLGVQGGVEQAPPRVRAHNDSGTQTEAILQFISKYLSLISLIALFLAGLASAYLFRTFVHKRFKEIAILQALGMKSQTAFSLSIIELIAISFISATLTCFLGAMLVPYIPILIGTFLPAGFAMEFSLRSVAITYVISVIGAVIFCLPILISIRKFPLSFLFTDEVKFYRSNRASFVASLLAIPSFFYLMALWLSNSFKTGSTFTLYFFGFVLLTFILGWFALRGIAWITPRLRYPFSFVARSILHYRVATLFYVAAISLSVMLITLVLQLERTIEEEAALPRGYSVPTFFFFNIIEERSAEFTSTADELGHPIDTLAPMLSGRLTHINNEEISASLGAEQEFEQEQRERANRRVNLSYREGLLPTETLYSGELFSGKAPEAGKPAEVSLEYDYAIDMGVGIGDILTMSLVDLPVSFEAKVVNLRRVKWNTFEPNFFIVLQPGVLEEFPKTYVSTLSMDGSEEEKVILQTRFSRAFPNLSVLDLQKIILYVLDIVNKMLILVKALALFSLVLGVFLLFSVVNYQVRERRKEINMLKVIGSKLSHIKQLVLAEYIFLGALSIFMGITTSLMLYYVVAVYIFENIFIFHPDLIAIISVIVMVIIITVSFLAASSTLRQKPIDLIKSTY